MTFPADTLSTAEQIDAESESWCQRKRHRCAQSKDVIAVWEPSACPRDWRAPLALLDNDDRRFVYELMQVFP